MILLGARGTFAGAVPPLLTRGATPPDLPVPTSSAMGDWWTRRVGEVGSRQGGRHPNAGSPG
jgi:hypothetical protein